MLFTSTLSQMLFLFLLISIGYFLAKTGLVPENSETVLSKLENYIFLPALVMSTFISNFTTEKLSSLGGLFIASVVLEAIVIPVSILILKFLEKDTYTRNVYLYGLCFANFGFTGNAVVHALFPDMFLEYTIFTLPLWIAIYIWAVPVLLTDNNFAEGGFKEHLKSFVNPMFVGMIVGMIIGIAGIPVPKFINNLVESLGGCMSPVAMLLTGMTVARYNIKDILKFKNIYVVTAIRLLIFPALFLVATKFINMSQTLVICGLCSIAMPLGLNTIVIPSAYGKDTKVASGMALVSHLVSCITIPIMFTILSLVV